METCIICPGRDCGRLAGADAGKSSKRTQSCQNGSQHESNKPVKTRRTKPTSQRWAGLIARMRQNEPKPSHARPENRANEAKAAQTLPVLRVLSPGDGTNDPSSSRERSQPTSPAHMREVERPVVKLGPDFTLAPSTDWAMATIIASTRPATSLAILASPPPLGHPVNAPTRAGRPFARRPNRFGSRFRLRARGPQDAPNLGRDAHRES